MQKTQIKGHYISPSPLSKAQIGISMQVQAKRHFNTNTSPSSLYCPKKLWWGFLKAASSRRALSQSIFGPLISLLWNVTWPRRALWALLPGAAWDASMWRRLLSNSQTTYETNCECFSIWSDDLKKKLVLYSDEKKKNIQNIGRFPVGLQSPRLLWEDVLFSTMITFRQFKNTLYMCGIYVWWEK